MLTRLLYAREGEASLTPASVQAKLEQVRVANERKHLTGMRAFDSNCFLQMLEGDREPLNRLFARIANDPRHKRVVLLEVAAVDERYFGRWSMAFAPADAAHGRLYLRFGIQPRLDPHALTAPAALALLRAMAPAQ
jgi:hypothetical protein